MRHVRGLIRRSGHTSQAIHPEGYEDDLTNAHLNELTRKSHVTRRVTAGATSEEEMLLSRGELEARNPRGAGEPVVMLGGEGRLTQ